MDITGSSAIVTGAASGIGAAVARQLAHQGAHVIVADLQAETGQALAAEIGGTFAQVDVTNTDQILAAVELAVSIAPAACAGEFRGHWLGSANCRPRAIL